MKKLMMVMMCAVCMGGYSALFAEEELWDANEESLVEGNATKMGAEDESVVAIEESEGDEAEIDGQEVDRKHKPNNSHGKKNPDLENCYRECQETYSRERAQCSGQCLRECAGDEDSRRCEGRCREKCEERASDDWGSCRADCRDAYDPDHSR